MRGAATALDSSHQSLAYHAEVLHSLADVAA